MIRLVHMTGQWYGIKLDGLEDNEQEIEALTNFIENGEAVLLIDELESLEEIAGLSIDPDTIQMIDR